MNSLQEETLKKPTVFEIHIRYGEGIREYEKSGLQKYLAKMGFYTTGSRSDPVSGTIYTYEYKDALTEGS